MALVDYPSTDDEEGLSPEDAPRKRKRDDALDDAAADLPPLPAAFHDLYAAGTRVSNRDDPSLHRGRKRVTPHVEGNWPSHVYLEWHLTPTEASLLAKLVADVESAGAHDARIESLLTSELGVPLPLHISLSRPLGFPTDERHAFLEALGARVRSCGVKPFDVCFTGLKWVPNFERTRWFLVLCVAKESYAPLRLLLQTCNAVVREFGQLPLYELRAPENTRSEMFGMKKDDGKRKARPIESPGGEGMVGDAQEIASNCHVSIAWSLEAPGPAVLAQTESKILDSTLQQGGRELRVRFDSVKVKVGNVVTAFELTHHTQERNGLLGI